MFLLSGRALGMIGAVTQMARDLQPSAVVLEDVDLVAEDRDYMNESGPVLFEVLDARDGAAADADLAFLLTTNPADVGADGFREGGDRTGLSNLGAVAPKGSI